MSRTTSQAIDGYVSDMLALEEHVAEVLAAQIAQLGERHGDVASQLSRCHRTVQDHVQALRKVRRVGSPWMGGVIAGAIKRAAAIAAGLEASGIDLVRLERLPKALRDDYGAASLATIGYVTLYTAAVSLNDELVTMLAARHLKDYAGITQILYGLMPGAVLAFLQEDGLPARAEALSGVERALEAVREGAAKAVPQPA